MRNGDVERVSAAHGESSDGAMLPVAHNAIVRFGVRHDVFDEILDEIVVEIGNARRTRAGRSKLKGPVCPAGITITIGLAFLSAIRLSMMKPARPTEVHESSESPAPCSR